MSTLLAGYIVCWLQNGKILPPPKKKKGPGYNLKLHLVELWGSPNKWKKNRIGQRKELLSIRGHFSVPTITIREQILVLKFIPNIEGRSLVWLICLMACVLGMTLNCIWWWGSNSGALESLEYYFILITPRFTLTWNGSTC